ncbi:MAG: HAD-IA family hydrolase [Kineosporiaceae bacterium]
MTAATGDGPGGSYRAVVLDWGGVLTAASLREAFGDWLARDAVAPAHFEDVMRRWLGRRPDRPGEAAGAVPDTPVHALERGHLAPGEFEAMLAAELRRLGSPVPAGGLLGRMLAGLQALEPLMIDLVRLVRSRGLRTAVLSNSWGEHYPDDVLDREFDEVVVSGRVGLRKPQPEMFHLVSDRLGLDPGACVLVDDLEVNVRAARAAGMAAVLHTDAATTRTAVLSLVDGAAGGGSSPGGGTIRRI